MDIAALSIIKSQLQLKQDVGISLMNKVMETAEQNAGLVNQMLDKVNDGPSAAQGKMPHLGNYIDRLV
ncbi:MAG: putative motility protein [Syntrophomonadaceae bacterium]|nr:putative motility protein [Syntrophomonadaceae bacterium]